MQLNGPYNYAILNYGFFGNGSDKHHEIAELGISLFEIAQSLFALERTFILGAMALLEAKSSAL